MSEVPTDSLHLRLAAANALIRKRRSIKPAQMSDEPIETWILGNLLENANWAPTHGMTEPWRFRVYEQDGREKLVNLLQSVYRESTAQEHFQEAKMHGFREKVLGAAATLVIWMKRQESEKIPEIEEIASVACAVQNLHLSASAIGLAGYWSSPALVYSEAMHRALELGEKDKCLGLFYVGWPANPEEWPESSRKPIREKLEWIDQ